MEYGNWTPEDWETLLYTIYRQNCILMLGPDAAVEKVEGQFCPLTELLAHELAEKLRPEIRKYVDPSNLAQVAQYYRLEHARNDLEAKVHHFYTSKKQQQNELYQTLAELPFYFVITSTPDTQLYNALKNRAPISERYHFRGKNPEMVLMGSVQHPLIYHLYGNIEEPESLVLTENNLLDFLMAIMRKNPPLPTRILSELRTKSKSFLFLGFGFKHWYLRILLHVLFEGQQKENRSFALEHIAPRNFDEFQRTILFYQKSEYKIQICNWDLAAFVKELHERYTRQYPAVSDSTILHASVQETEGPKVFICHASENKDVAAYLSQKLEAAGFQPWFDQKDIRGGDRWDLSIEKTIKEDIDYFVVLQSQVMEQKFRSYFHKEIHLALAQQQCFKSNIRFVIPVKIESCHFSEDLEHLHTIDISNRDNIQQVIEVIKEDQRRRQKLQM